MSWVTVRVWEVTQNGFTAKAIPINHQVHAVRLKVRAMHMGSIHHLCQGSLFADITGFCKKINLFRDIPDDMYISG